MRTSVRWLVIAAFVASVFVPALSSPAAAETVDCVNYDAWEWAQAVFDSDPQKYDALDPDNDGTACPMLPRGGFAPAIWTDTMPDGLQRGTIIRLIDGDTLEVDIDGVPTKVRIYRADTPETQNKHECGGQEATNFATWALSFNDDPGVVYIEKDKTDIDRYGRSLAYIWFEIDGQPYQLNYILINNGWAADKDYGDRMYDDELKGAAAFAKRHDLGVWASCGGFGVPLADAPVAAPQPSVPNPAPPANQPASELPAQQDPVYNPPAAQEPEYVPPVEAPAPAPDCDPNYTPCVPNVPYDLNCPDIGHSVTVIGYDRHGFDRDGDGWGCESYG